MKTYIIIKIAYETAKSSVTIFAPGILMVTTFPPWISLLYGVNCTDKFWKTVHQHQVS